MRRLSTVLLVCLAGVAGEVARSQEPAVSPARSPRNASYRIEARLDPVARTLIGRQVLTWRNLQQQPASELCFHLYWNAWRNNRSTWMLEDRIRGRSTARGERDETDWSYQLVDSARLLSIRPAAPLEIAPAGPSEGEEVAQDLSGALRFVSPDDGNPEDRTVLMVELPQPVVPGGTAQIEMTWRAKVPRTFARTGYQDDFYFAAHWFPKLGVFEEDGWNCHQFHSATEFYSDYGVYDVELTVPESYVLGATGRLLERRANGDGTATFHHRQEDVHGFAWTASPRFLDLRERFQAEGLPPVNLRLLLQPEHRDQAERHFAATRATLEHYGRWYGPYPYEQLTIVDPAYGSGAGGMEYPTLFTAGTRLFNPPGGGSPEAVTIHEAGHQFWYGVVGNNEFEHAWIDEGLNTFSTARAYEAAFGPRSYVKRYLDLPGRGRGGFLPLLFEELTLSREVYGNRMERYRQVASSDVQATPTFLYYPATASSITYNKTALWLATLERYVGWDTLRRILSTFYQRWSFRHPRPEDFFAVAEEVSGQELSWFFDQVHGGSQVFDYAIGRAESKRFSTEGFEEEPGGALRFAAGPERVEESTGGTAAPYRTEVVAQRRGEGVFPVAVLLTFEDGTLVRHAWQGRERWKLFVEYGPSRLVSAEVDPQRVLLLDVDRTNNSRLVEARSTLPAYKWGARWMVWLQDLLQTFAFFV